MQEINFDGLIGPSHNYAGLSLGNLASAHNAGARAFPRAAALQGLAKMRRNVDMGLKQGLLLPHDRPNDDWLQALGSDAVSADAALRAAAFSASAMWAANAATVSPAPDTSDGRCHLTVANLVTMPHRSHEWPQTLRQLQLAFGDRRHFVVHGPVPPPFGDEGAANHMRLTPSHGEAGLEIFVYGENAGAYPARQHRQASAAVARRHGLRENGVMFLRQSDAAINAGAFHNDVVAVANETVLFAHELAFADRERAYAEITTRAPWAQIVEAPDSALSLGEAVQSYLFNAQLVSLPGGGGMALILPTEARETPRVWRWLERHVAGNGPIRELVPVDVRQSMANGGGPACLRLRVVCDPTHVDPRFLLDTGKIAHLAEIVEAHWPDHIDPIELKTPDFADRLRAARGALLSALDLTELG